MYDLDGTLIQPKSGNKFPKNADDWKWWHAKVKPKLAEAHSQGYVVRMILLLKKTEGYMAFR